MYVCIQYEVASRLVGHSDSVTVADATYINADNYQLLVVSASADCSLRVWFRSTCTAGALQASFQPSIYLWLIDLTCHYSVISAKSEAEIEH